MNSFVQPVSVGLPKCLELNFRGLATLKWKNFPGRTPGPPHKNHLDTLPSYAPEYVTPDIGSTPWKPCQKQWHVYVTQWGNDCLLYMWLFLPTETSTILKLKCRRYCPVGAQSKPHVCDTTDGDLLTGWTKNVSPWPRRVRATAAKKTRENISTLRTSKTISSAGSFESYWIAQNTVWDHSLRSRGRATVCSLTKTAVWATRAQSLEVFIVCDSVPWNSWSPRRLPKMAEVAPGPKRWR